MRIGAAAVLGLAVVAGACAGGRAPEPAVEAADGVAAMGWFARMMGGEWRMESQSGHRQFDRWSWGPGRLSVDARTHGVDGGGNPWRQVMVAYWAAARGEVRVLELNPDIPGLGLSVGAGTIALEGEGADASYDLYQPGHPGRAVRELALRWDFDGADAYRERLLEKDGERYGLLGEWAYERSRVLSDPPEVEGAAARPSGGLGAFGALAGGVWEGVRDGVRRRAAFEWVPYVRAVIVRVDTVDDAGGARPALRAYIYGRPRTDEVRCLVLTEEGGVYEGTMAEREGGVRLGLEGDEHGEAARRVIGWDLGAGGVLRERGWRVEDGEERLVFDGRMERVE